MALLAELAEVGAVADAAFAAAEAGGGPVVKIARSRRGSKLTDADLARMPAHEQRRVLRNRASAERSRKGRSGKVKALERSNELLRSAIRLKEGQLRLLALC